jgi:hypothetical protein
VFACACFLVLVLVGLDQGRVGVVGLSVLISRVHTRAGWKEKGLPFYISKKKSKRKSKKQKA